ncbi:MAG: Glu/Leu/Phe/Val dehydrogenase dimerization domain-containing protein [Myxococcota bacterium]|nr:Glu/Leu/Phe/Val dehydrogenase dimerization domain-containing protein [Myxococcota bacterium]
MNLGVLDCEVFSISDEAFGILGWIAMVPSARKVSFGGCRVSPTVSSEEVCELARSMHCKLLAHGLPTGGAKGGLIADPRGADLLDRAEAFGRAAESLLSSRVVLGKDMGASDALMAAIYRGAGVTQLQLVQGSSENCPDRIGDLAGYRRHMTGLGVSWASLAARGGDLEQVRVLIQGCGVVGMGSAVRLSEQGAEVLGMSDVSGARTWDTGRTAKDFVEVGSGTGITGLDFPGVRELGSADALLAEPADVLVLAASSNCVDARLARLIAAPIVVEGANFALTGDAREVLLERGVMVVPDLIASSSSAAFVAHQLASGNTRKPEKVWEEIQDSIESSVGSARLRARETNGSLRQAHLEGTLESYL